MGEHARANGSRRRWIAAVLGAVLAVSVAAACSDDGDDDSGGADSDTARYVLPPGNYGGLPTNEHSLDQLPLYDGLTPLRGNITTQNLEDLFLPLDFAPIEPTTVEETPRDGVEIIYDAYGIAHITGETREDVAYGAGWVTARDRSLLIQLALGPARAAVADIPGIDAFGLVTSGRSFVPSPEAEALVDAQWDLLIEDFGEEGETIKADAEAGAEGANAYWASVDDPFTVTANDVLAATAFIGSIFGAGGGAEADNANFLATLQAGLGDERGYDAWNDAMLALDPEAPTTIDETFDYGPLTGGDVTGSLVLDADSIVAVNLDPSDDDEDGDGDDAGEGAGNGSVRATAAPPARQASNWLVANRSRTATGSTQAVMGPQLGYYYPEIVQQVHLKGPDFEVQGAAVPGLTMYMLIGRTADYAWSLTSAGHDVRDVYAEELCEPDGAAPTRGSTHYVFDGECTAMETFDAGTLDGNPIEFQMTVHGPVIGTATADGAPYALSRKRSTYGRDALNIVALKRMTEGQASTPEAFYEVANQFEFTFNWGWASRDDTAFFTSGRLPVRPEGLDRRLPTLGTGEYEWEGFLEQDDHPHAEGGSDGLLLNWNNQSAPGFLHGDGGSGYGSIHRLLLFDQWPDETQLTDVVGVMNRAATEDDRSPVWPVISEVLATGTAPSELAGQLVEILDDWVADDAPRLDADDDGDYDSPGPAIFDELFQPLVETAMRPVYGDLLPALQEVRNLSGDEGASYLDKDLRTLLGRDVDGPFALSYCGEGDLDACAASLWTTVEDVATAMAAEHGDDPQTWLVEAVRVGFQPGLIPETFRWTNRPTYQQIFEWARND